MRRLSTLSALAAGAIALLLGVYVTQGTQSGVTKANAAQAFAPNGLLIQSDLKLESWDAF
jgi:hypothetical protein